MKRTTIVSLRKKNKKTQRKSAEELKISEIYLRKIESGTVTPGRDMLLRFENYFNTPMQELFPDIFLKKNDTKCINDY